MLTIVYVHFIKMKLRPSSIGVIYSPNTDILPNNKPLAEISDLIVINIYSVQYHLCCDNEKPDIICL